MKPETEKPPQSIAVLVSAYAASAEHSVGAEIARALAENGARILLPYVWSRRQTLGLAAELAARGAVVLPLETVPPENAADWSRLFQRSVENFGRLEAVVFCPTPPGEAGQGSKTWPCADALEACAGAAGPFLRGARPGGGCFILAYPADAARLGRRRALGAKQAFPDTAALKGKDWQTGRNRARFCEVPWSGSPAAFSQAVRALLFRPQ